MAERDGALRGRATSTLAVGPGASSFLLDLFFFVLNFVPFLDLVFGLWFLDLALLRHQVLFLLLFLLSITVFYVERKNNFLKYFL